MAGGFDLKDQKYRILSGVLLFVGVFTLAVGAGMFYFASESSDVKIISAENYDDWEIGSVAGAKAENPVNINTATTLELENLPGVGPVTAGKIIAGRPYVTVDELVIKKAVGRSIYEKISPLVTVDE